MTVLAGLYLFLGTSPALAATATWTNTGGDGLWATCANWSGGTGAGGCPGTSDVATFNNTSTANATIAAGAAISVQGINIASNYTGTITQTTTATITVGSSGWSQAGGTFTGGSGAINIASGASTFLFSLTGGTFTSTSGTMTLTGQANVAGSAFTINGGTFNHNNGKVIIDKGGNANDATITGSATFYQLSFGNGGFNDVYTIASGTLTVVNTLAFSINNCGTLNGPGGITAQGNIDIGANTCGVNYSSTESVITVNGTGDQTITGGTSGYNYLPSLTINKPSGNLTFVNTFAINGLSFV